MFSRENQMKLNPILEPVISRYTNEDTNRWEKNNDIIYIRKDASQSNITMSAGLLTI